MPENAVAGDVLVLTKPLGTQLAVNLSEWLRDGLTRPADKNRYAKVCDIVSPEGAMKAFKAAERSMCRLNRTGARMMHKDRKLIVPVRPSSTTMAGVMGQRRRAGRALATRR